MNFETVRKEIEVKLQKELSGEYKKIQVCDYFDNEGITENHFFCEICVNIINDWDEREIGMISFTNGEITEVIGQVNGYTIRALQKIIQTEEN